MEWPILEPAPGVSAHTGVFRDLLEHQCPFRHFQHDLTALLVLPTKSLAHMARCRLDSADNTTLSRWLSEAPWREDASKHRRSRCMRHQTTPHRRRRRESVVVRDDTRCEPGGRLLDYVDRHAHPSNGTYPLAPNPVTSGSVSGPVRLPLDRRLYGRDAELTPWEAAGATHVPDAKLPTDNKARTRLHKQGDPVWLQAPACRVRHAQCRTTIALAIERRAEAIRPTGPCGVVVFDAWSLAEDLIQVWARRRKAWSSRLQTNRRLETASFRLRDANGWTLQLPGPHLAVAELGPLLPATAYRPVKVGEPTYGCFTLAVRIPGWGQVRRVVSCEPEALTGRYGVLVTNRPDWSAAQIISLYAPRWPTETVAQDGKGHLGFKA